MTTRTVTATKEGVTDALLEIQTELDQIVPRAENLRAQRTQLWQLGRNLGMTCPTLARLSGVRAVTVSKGTNKGDDHAQEEEAR